MCYEDNYYVLYTLNKYNVKIYIANTNPVYYTMNVADAKKFANYDSAITEFTDYKDVFDRMIKYTDIVSIHVAEFDNLSQLREERLL